VKPFSLRTKTAGNGGSVGFVTFKKGGPIMTKTFRTAGLLIALSAGVLAAPTASFAFSSEAQQMCTGDAFRLCSSEIPDVSKITACMMQHKTSLSAGCRTVMERDLAQQSGKVAAR
jgi:hypothetical protein